MRLEKIQLRMNWEDAVVIAGNGSLRDMKDYNNHAISKKQQEKFLEMGENLNIFIPWMKKRRILPKPRMILPLYPAIPQEDRKPHICPVKPL